MKRNVLLGLALLAPALLFSQTDPTITLIQPTDPIQGSQDVLNGNFTNLKNAVIARPPASGAKTANAITVYDADGNLVASGCRVVSGNLECGTGATSSGIELPELASNGTNSFSIYGKDNQAASACIILPDSNPAAGETLKSSGTTATTTDAKTCVVMEWGTASGGGSDRVAVPATSSATCTAGTWAANASYFFYCAATDTWARTALATWQTVATPTFTPASPYSGGTTSVTIATATSGATIKYCTGADDTCDPAAGSTYAAPVDIASSSYLRAIATKADNDDSAIASWQGTIATGLVTDNFTSGFSGTAWTNAWPSSGYPACTADATGGVGGTGGVKPAASYQKCAAFNTDASLGADGYAQVDYQMQIGAMGGVIWRATSDNFYSVTVRDDGAGPYFQFRKTVAGASEYITEAHPDGFAVTVDNWYTMKVTYSGSTFHVFFGTQGGALTEMASFTDSTLTTGKPGFAMQDDGGGGLPNADNFEAQ